MDRLEWILAQLTQTQRRRYLYYIKDWTLADIAKKEGVTRQAVWKSLYLGKKKIQKKTKNIVKKG